MALPCRSQPSGRPIEFAECIGQRADVHEIVPVMAAAEVRDMVAAFALLRTGTERCVRGGHGRSAVDGFEAVCISQLTVRTLFLSRRVGA